MYYIYSLKFLYIIFIFRNFHDIDLIVKILIFNIFKHLIAILNSYFYQLTIIPLF